jgi:uncharacterized membrane protein
MKKSNIALNEWGIFLLTSHTLVSIVACMLVLTYTLRAIDLRSVKSRIALVLHGFSVYWMELSARLEVPVTESRTTRTTLKLAAEALQGQC